MIRLAPLITADVDNATLPGGKASDAAQDFLALLSEALAGETTTDKAAPQLLVATDKPTTKGEPLVSEILADAQQADLLIPVDETPPVINDAGMAKLAADCARDIVGDEKVIDHVDAPNMGGEDFAYYVKQVPGAFLFLSSANPEKHTDVPHHNPKFNVDEDVFWIGSALFVRIAEKFLGIDE